MAWKHDYITEDPSEVLLKLVTQSAARARAYAAEIEEIIADVPSLRAALIEGVWIPTEHGETYKAGEKVRKLVQLEAQERDRCAAFATKSIAAGLAERMVSQKERIGDLVFDWFEVVLKASGLPEEDQQRFKTIAFEKLKLLRGSKAG